MQIIELVEEDIHILNDIPILLYLKYVPSGYQLYISSNIHISRELDPLNNSFILTDSGVVVSTFHRVEVVSLIDVDHVDDDEEYSIRFYKYKSEEPVIICHIDNLTMMYINRELNLRIINEYIK